MKQMQLPSASLFLPDPVGAVSSVATSGTSTAYLYNSLVFKQDGSGGALDDECGSWRIPPRHCAEIIQGSLPLSPDCRDLGALDRQTSARSQKRLAQGTVECDQAEREQAGKAN